MKYMVQYSLHTSIDIYVEASSEDEAEKKALPISDQVWDIVTRERHDELEALGCPVTHTGLDLNAAFDERDPGFTPQGEERVHAG